MIILNIPNELQMIHISLHTNVTLISSLSACVQTLICFIYIFKPKGVQMN